ncbi:hypothetical protein KKA03_00095 [archaeon]|nr:hypothetical protein [archaeon]
MVTDTAVFYSSGAHYLRLPSQFIVSDVIAGILLLIGMIYLASVMKVFMGGDEVRKYATTPVVGILLYTILHQGGEFMCETSLHGGFPSNIFGTIHIVVLQSIGGLVFLVGSALFYFKMRALLKGG